MTHLYGIMWTCATTVHMAELADSDTLTKSDMCYSAGFCLHFDLPLGVNSWNVRGDEKWSVGKITMNATGWVNHSVQSTNNAKHCCCNASKDPNTIVWLVRVWGKSGWRLRSLREQVVKHNRKDRDKARYSEAASEVRHVTNLEFIQKS